MTKGNNNEDKGMDKKDEEGTVGILVFGVIVLGLLLIGISILFKDPVHYIIRGLGISIIGGAFIAWAIGHLLSKAKFQKLIEDMQELYKKISETDKNINETVKRTSEEIITDTTEISRKIIATDKNINDINENIRSSFKLIKESEDIGLLKIYEPYDMRFKCLEMGGQASDEFTHDIKEMLKTEEKEIKICGLSLRQFFTDERKFAYEMRKAFKRMSDSNEFCVKILLIYPESDWKDQRETAEDKFAKLKLGTDLEQSISWLKSNIRNLKNKDKIMDNIRFYNATPDFFLFITSQCIIFENYHMGAFQLEKETDDAVQNLGLGGHVPAFMFDNESSMYKYLSAQFDYYFEKNLAGKKLFNMDIGLEGNLNKDNIIEKVKNKFKGREFPLSGNATIREERTDEWEITDGEKIYIIKKEKGVLNTYIGKRNEYHVETLKEWLESRQESSIEVNQE